MYTPRKDLGRSGTRTRYPQTLESTTRPMSYPAVTNMNKIISNSICCYASLMLSVAALQIKFWSQILKSPGKLIYNAYQEDIRNDSRGVKNWVTGVKIVLERCGLTHFWQNQTIPSNFNISKCVYNILKHKYENLFFNSINSETGVTKTGGNKLNYLNAKLKHEYKMENYLN